MPWCMQLQADGAGKGQHLNIFGWNAGAAAGVAGLQAAIDGPSRVRGVQLMNISLRMLHISKQSPIQRPLVRALQTTLRTTGAGAAVLQAGRNAAGARAWRGAPWSTDSDTS